MQRALSLDISFQIKLVRVTVEVEWMVYTFVVSTVLTQYRIPILNSCNIDKLDR